MLRPQAGAVIHDVEGPKLSRIPFIVFLAIVFCAPIYFQPAYWYIGVGGFGLFTAIYWFASNQSEALVRVRAICDNGVVIVERGVETVIPWSLVKTVTTATYRQGRGYSINTLEAQYRIGQGLSTAKLKAVVDTVVAKVPLEWIHDNVAVRSENAADARKTMDNILAQIGR